MIMWRASPKGFRYIHRLDNCETESDLEKMAAELNDRFGPIPPQVDDLFTTVRCRKLAVDLGFEKMSLKDNILRCYFINRPDSPYFESATFTNVLSYLQKETNKAKLKQVGKMFLLIVSPVNGMPEMLEFLQKLHRFCFTQTKVIA